MSCIYSGFLQQVIAGYGVLETKIAACQHHKLMQYSSFVLEMKIGYHMVNQLLQVICGKIAGNERSPKYLDLASAQAKPAQACRISCPLEVACNTQSQSISRQVRARGR